MEKMQKFEDSFTIPFGADAANSINAICVALTRTLQTLARDSKIIGPCKLSISVTPIDRANEKAATPFATTAPQTAPQQPGGVSTPQPGVHAHGGAPNPNAGETAASGGLDKGNHGIPEGDPGPTVPHSDHMPAGSSAAPSGRRTEPSTDKETRR